MHTPGPRYFARRLERFADDSWGGHRLRFILMGWPAQRVAEAIAKARGE